MRNQRGKILSLYFASRGTIEANLEGEKPEVCRGNHQQDRLCLNSLAAFPFQFCFIAVHAQMQQQQQQ